MVNMKPKNILLFNSDKVDIKTKTNKLLHSVRDVWNNLLESFSNEYFKLHQARRTLLKTGTASVASKKTELGVWGGALSPPSGVLEGGARYENF